MRGGPTSSALSVVWVVCLLLAQSDLAVAQEFDPQPDSQQVDAGETTDQAEPEQPAPGPRRLRSDDPSSREAAIADEVARDPEGALRHARYAYEHGDYADAMRYLRALLYPLKLAQEDDIVQAHETLGLCYYLTGRLDAARDEFVRLLTLRPAHRLDPFFVPPNIVEFFDSVLDSYREKLTQIEEERARQAAEARRREAIEAERTRREQLRRERIELLSAQVVEREIVRHNLALTFLPFGAGQFQNGEPLWGWLFLGAELGMLSLNLASWAAIRSSRDGVDAETGAYIYNRAEAFERAQFLQKTMLAGGYLALGLYLWQVVDGLIGFQPEIEVWRSAPLSSAADRRGALPVGRAAQLSPWLAPGGGGLVLRLPVGLNRRN